MSTAPASTNLRNLKSSELITLYNTAAEKLGVRTVNKFSDKETAIARTRAIMAKVGTEVTAEEVRRTSSFPPPPANSPVDAASEPAGEISLRKARATMPSPAPEPSAPEAPVSVKVSKRMPKPVKEPRQPKVAGPMDNLPKSSRMSFAFKPLTTAHAPKGSANSLRSLCYARMNKGCTYRDVVSLIEQFDAGRGKGNANTIDRRAYELIRLMHYALGFGISHDEATGQIKLYTK